MFYKRYLDETTEAFKEHNAINPNKMFFFIDIVHIETPRLYV